MTAPGSPTGATVRASAADVRVIRGTPDDVELAALVAGLVAAASSPALPEDPPRSAWSDRSRTLPGAQGSRDADGWRWSLRS
ncbi:acyl-CoA carboxylase epsilon subunit [Sanguibacter antarcticus]|uniref:Acyl-CoA carboxylase epsilon subunit-like protein n=1 Tax=Sanguibacter antarcticus TaxID=372484 RepID=A0A2A9E4D8_9MICO|nr:acyl-CoA carboxylase epsilon subunit [Sanguibacter antarcticus]PFG33703.1 acyl-CoA carboxylase epsilon subunit-like protein [Sanguibacter antarcticus]